jgi:hypothetical protein
MSSNNEVLKLRTLLGDYPNTMAMKNGEVVSPRIAFDFADINPPNKGFKQVVKGEFDAAELAIMTYLQAKGWGRPLVALPIVLHGRFQYGQLAYNAERGRKTSPDSGWVSEPTPRRRPPGSAVFSRMSSVWTSTASTGSPLKTGMCRNSRIRRTHSVPRQARTY